METLLTDDEVAAIAAYAEAPWPTALPSVDPSDAESLRAAMMRGARSLSVRRLMPGRDAEAEPLVGLMKRFGHADFVAVGVVVGAEGDDATPRGDTTLIAVTGEDAVVAQITPAGIHQWGSRPAADAADLIARPAGEVFDGAAGELPAAWLVSHSGATGRALRVSSAHAEWVRVRGDSVSPDGPADVRDGESASDAVRTFLRSRSEG